MLPSIVLKFRIANDNRRFYSPWRALVADTHQFTIKDFYYLL